MHDYPVAVSWQEYEKHIKSLLTKIQAGKIKIENLICLSEDSFLIAQAIKKYFDIKTEIIIYSHNKLTTMKSVFLVQDIVEEKSQLEKIVANLKNQGVSEIISAAIWKRTDTGFSPDFHVTILTQYEKLITPLNNFNYREKL